MSRRIRKAVIPAAGKGTRFLPATKSQPKEMLPIVDKPAIQFVVEEAVRAGIDDILVITGQGKKTLEDHFDRSFDLEATLEASGKFDLLKQVREIADMASIHYVRQGEARGLGHAVSMARQHVGNEAFAVMLGDDIMIETARVLEGMLEVHERYGASVVAVKQVTRREISAYGSATPEAVDGEDNLVRIRDVVEKPEPDEAPSTLAVIGRYVFTPDIFDVLDRTEPGAGGEIQLTDAIKALADDQPVYGYVFEHGRYDAGDKLDYLRATVELALDRHDLGPAFQEILVDIVKRRNLL